MICPPPPLEHAPKELRSNSKFDTPPPLPEKSDYVKLQQEILYKTNIQQGFSAMGERLPPRKSRGNPRVGITESDALDMLDMTVRLKNEIKNLSLAESATLLSDMTSNPIFWKNSRYFSAHTEDIIIEATKYLPYHSDSSAYKEMLGNIYDKLDKSFSSNLKIKEILLNKEFKQNTDFVELAQEVIPTYTSALEDMGLQTGLTKFSFSDEHSMAFFEYETGELKFPTIEKYKEIYLQNTPNLSSTEVGISLLSAIVHEMTHKQQKVFEDNLNNPNISEDIKNYAKILKVNKMYYIEPEKDVNLYQLQLIEVEAFANAQRVENNFKFWLDRGKK